MVDKDYELKRRHLNKSISSIDNILKETKKVMGDNKRTYDRGNIRGKVDDYKEEKKSTRLSHSTDEYSSGLKYSVRELSRTLNKFSASLQNFSKSVNLFGKISYSTAGIKSGVQWGGRTALGMAKEAPNFAYQTGKFGLKAATSPFRAAARPMAWAGRESGRAARDIVGDPMGEMIQSYKKLFGAGLLPGGPIAGSVFNRMIGNKLTKPFRGKSNSSLTGGKEYYDYMKNMGKSASKNMSSAYYGAADWSRGMPQGIPSGSGFVKKRFGGGKGGSSFESNLALIPAKIDQTNQILTGKSKVSKNGSVPVVLDSESEEATKWFDKLKIAFKESAEMTGKHFTLGLDSIFGLKTAFSYMIPFFGMGYRSELPRTSWIKRHGMNAAMLQVLELIYLHSRYASKEANDQLLQISKLLKIGFDIKGSLKRPTPRSISEWIGTGIRNLISAPAASFTKGLVGNNLSGLSGATATEPELKGKGRSKTYPGVMVKRLTEIRDLLDQRLKMAVTGATRAEKSGFASVGAGNVDSEGRKYKTTGFSWLKKGTTVTRPGEESPAAGSGGGFFSKLLGGLLGLPWLHSIYDTLMDIKEFFTKTWTSNEIESKQKGGLIAGLYNVFDKSVEKIGDKIYKLFYGKNYKTAPDGFIDRINNLYQNLLPDSIKNMLHSQVTIFKEGLQNVVGMGSEFAQSIQGFTTATTSFVKDVMTPLRETWTSTKGNTGNKLMETLMSIPDAVKKGGKGKSGSFHEAGGHAQEGFNKLIEYLKMGVNLEVNVMDMMKTVRTDMIKKVLPEKIGKGYEAAENLMNKYRKASLETRNMLPFRILAGVFGWDYENWYDKEAGKGGIEHPEGVKKTYKAKRKAGGGIFGSIATAAYDALKFSFSPAVNLFNLIIKDLKTLKKETGKFVKDGFIKNTKGLAQETGGKAWKSGKELVNILEGIWNFQRGKTAKIFDGPMPGYATSGEVLSVEPGDTVVNQKNNPFLELLTSIADATHATAIGVGTGHLLKSGSVGLLKLGTKAVGGGIDIATSIGKQIPTIISEVLKTSGAAIRGVIKPLAEVAANTINHAINGMSSVLGFIGHPIKSIGKGIGNITGGIGKAVAKRASKITSWIKGDDTIGVDPQGNPIKTKGFTKIEKQLKNIYNLIKRQYEMQLFVSGLGAVGSGIKGIAKIGTGALAGASALGAGKGFIGALGAAGRGLLKIGPGAGLIGAGLAGVGGLAGAMNTTSGTITGQPIETTHSTNARTGHLDAHKAILEHTNKVLDVGKDVVSAGAKAAETMKGGSTVVEATNVLAKTSKAAAAFSKLSKALPIVSGAMTGISSLMSGDSIFEAIGSGVGSGVGGKVGMSIGAALGAPFPPFGPFIGGALGGIAGAWLGEKLGKWTGGILDKFGGAKEAEAANVPGSPINQSSGGSEGSGGYRQGASGGIVGSRPKYISAPLNASIEDKIKASIKSKEGLVLKPYMDNGQLAIGYGHKILPGEMQQFSLGITKADADAIFERDFQIHKNAAAQLPEYRGLDDVRKAGLIEMTYVLGGSKIKEFRGTLDALSRQDWEGASKGVKDSLWGRQSPSRSGAVADIFKSGSEGDIRATDVAVYSADSNFKQFATGESVSPYGDIPPSVSTAALADGAARDASNSAKLYSDPIIQSQREAAALAAKNSQQNANNMLLKNSPATTVNNVNNAGDGGNTDANHVQAVVKVLFGYA